MKTNKQPVEKPFSDTVKEYNKKYQTGEPEKEKSPKPADTKKIQIELKTRIVMDNLRYGWACPICGVIYSPYVCKCSDPGCKVFAKKEEQHWEVKK